LIDKEEKEELAKQTNKKTLMTLRSILIDFPPVLTVELKLGNLRRSDS